MSAVRLFEQRANENSKPVQIPFNGVSASFAYQASDADPVGLIDDSIGKVWHVWGQAGRPHQVALRLAQPLDVVAGQTFKFELDHANRVDIVNSGRFRLAVTGDANAFERVQKRSAAMKLADPWAKLAAVYHVVGDQQALERLLEQHPQAAAGIGDLYALDENWQQAIELYSKLITDQTTNATLLSKRAAAYIATEQWNLAKADWLRAVEQQPDQLQQAFDVFRNAEQWSTAAEFGQRLLEQQPRNSNHWPGVAAVLVLSEDEIGYAEFCQWIAEKSLVDPVAAERAIKSSLLRASGFDLAALPAATLTDALDSGSYPEWFPAWGWQTRSLLAHRSGDAESAVKYVAKSEEHNPNEHAHATNLAVLSLAEHELGHPDEARTALAAASQLITRLNEDSANKGHHDLLIAEILIREVEEKIGRQTGPDPK